MKYRIPTLLVLSLLVGIGMVTTVLTAQLIRSHDQSQNKANISHDSLHGTIMTTSNNSGLMPIDNKDHGFPALWSHSTADPSAFFTSIYLRNTNQKTQTKAIVDMWIHKLNVRQQENVSKVIWSDIGQQSRLLFFVSIEEGNVVPKDFDSLLDALQAGHLRWPQ